MTFPNSLTPGASDYVAPTPYIAEAGIPDAFTVPLGDDRDGLVLDCPLTTGVELTKGIGGVTFSRGATTQWVEDFEGILRPVYGDAPAMHGTRVVSNLLRNSEDFSQSSWNKDSGSSSSNIDSITFAAGSSSTGRFYQSITQNRVGNTYRVSIIIPPSSKFSDPTTTIYCSSSTLDIAGAKSVVPNSNYQRISVIDSPTSPQTTFTITIWSSKATTCSERFRCQLENVTGQTIQTPSEYVENTSSSVPATRCFVTTNANTVDANGVVTEATGTSLTNTMKGILLEPTRTNRVTCYNTIPGDTYGSTLNSGTATVGKVYEIVVRTDIDWEAVGTRLSGSANTAGAKYLITGSLTFDANDTGKEVVLGVGTKADYSGSFRNPITNLTLGGDTASTLSIVDDSANLPTALKHLCSSGKAYKVDNSAGSTSATVTIGGTTGSTSATSISCWIRGGTGKIQIGTVTGQTFAASTPYARVYQENVTPGSTSDQMVITVDAGQTVYFVMPQMEVGAFITSEIVAAGSTGTRTSTTFTISTAYYLYNRYDFRSEKNAIGTSAIDFSIALEFSLYGNIHANGTGDRILQSTYDSNNYWFVSLDSSYFRLVLLNNNSSDNRISTYSSQQQYKYAVVFSRNNEDKIFVNQSKGSISRSMPSIISKNISVPIGTTFFWNSANGYLKNFRIYNKPLSDARCIQLTS